MSPLSQEDLRHLNAAEGWCGLGAFAEANEELENVSATARAHPRVLEIRWQVYVNFGKWEGALEIAKALTKITPDRPEGWIYLASSQTQLKSPDLAYDTLVLAAKKFPRDEIIHYDLACVCCKLNRLPEAQMWLIKAIDIGGKEIKLRALDDNDLEPIWVHL